jgi:hypothetical protein
MLAMIIMEDMINLILATVMISVTTIETNLRCWHLLATEPTTEKKRKMKLLKNLFYDIAQGLTRDEDKAKIVKEIKYQESIPTTS